MASSLEERMKSFTKSSKKNPHMLLEEFFVQVLNLPPCAPDDSAWITSLEEDKYDVLQRINEQFKKTILSRCATLESVKSGAYQ